MRIKNFWDDLVIWLGAIVFVVFFGLWIFLSARERDRKIHEYKERGQEIERKVEMNNDLYIDETPDTTGSARR